MKLGTRGSDLALIQTQRVRSRLSDIGVESEYEIVKTSGDRFQDLDYSKIGGQGVFVRELDALVVEGELDGAVHSMKDMPTERPADLVVAAVPERAAAGDVLVTTDGKDIDDLREGAVVGTSSLRRRAQLKRYRPDLEVKNLRGNVDTRVEKLREGEYDAIVLSGAGLERMDIDIPYERLNPDDFVPSANQGVIAVVAMDGTDAFDALHKIDDPATRVTTTAERVIISRIGGGCVVPMGAFARIEGENILIRTEVLSLDGSEEVKVERRVPVQDYYEEAKDIAEEMIEKGGKELVERTAEKVED
ncbi:MAG: hydroxymethylbilane synthase [Halobacteria archaeon]|nr:hydroxymethylbilane synthase [Halobacteria archaeon]